MNKELYDTLSNLSPEAEEFIIAYLNATPRSKAVITKVLYNQDNPELWEIMKGISNGLYTLEQAYELIEMVNIA